MTGTHKIALCLAAALLFIAGISTAAEPSGPSFNGVLFRSLFSPEPFHVSDLDNAAFSALPDTLRKRITAYAERRAKFVSRLKTPNPPPGFELGVLLENRRLVEKGIYSLATGPGIGEKAAGYARDAKLYYEWEGISEAPLDEAEYAESHREDPQLKPYLLLFLLHRYRCAYECLIAEKNPSLAKEISGEYRKTLKIARKHPDPLVRLIAEDLDRIPGNIYNDSRYTRGDVHP